MVRSRFPYCFACGESNPIGLHLSFSKNGSFVEAVFTPTEFHQGYPDIVHGGIVTTLLDEAMAYALEFDGYRGVTARLKVTFLKPLRPRNEYRIMGYLGKIRGKIARAYSEVRDNDDNTIAKAEALFFINSEIGGDQS